MSPATQDFAYQHRLDDPARLLLGKAPDGVDLKAAAQQIEGWQTARTKWPRLAANPLVWYPPRLNREQASSKATAAYKAHLLSTLRSPLSTLRVADLTSGMGIDALAFASVADSVDAFEINPDLCNLLAHNAGVLGLHNLRVHNANSIDTLLSQPQAAASSPNLGEQPSYCTQPTAPAKQGSSAAPASSPPKLGGVPRRGEGVCPPAPAKQGFSTAPASSSPKLGEVAARRADGGVCPPITPIIPIPPIPPTYDIIYIDPARRDSSGRRVAAFEDCTPDILAAMPTLRASCRWLLVKASPMVDITQALRQLPAVSELHIVALNGECKELLFLIDFRFPAPDTKITCVNLPPTAPIPPIIPITPPFSYPLSATAPQPPLATAQPRHLLVPDATIMKAACHNLVAQRFRLQLLTPGGHIFAADAPVDGFPGRIFRVDAEVQLDRRSLRPLLPDWRASIISRGHPLAADAIRRRLRLADAPADAPFIIATAFASRPVAYLCSRLA